MQGTESEITADSCFHVGGRKGGLNIRSEDRTSGSEKLLKGNHDEHGGADECKIEGKGVFVAIPSDVFYDSK